MEFDSTQQNVAWFRDRYKEGTLVIKPPFQRKPVWAERQKCSLIESLLLHLPVPEVFVQQVVDPASGKVTFAVVDGQQRIRTVLQFIGSEIDPRELDTNRFRLDRLPADSAFLGKSFTDLNDTQRGSFYSYRFTVRLLTAASDDEVRGMFTRLNQFLSPLKPQELRNAMYVGPFVQLANRLADESYWAESQIIMPASIRRMGDIEFVSELLIGIIHGPQGGGAKEIDEYYRQFEDYEDEFPDQKRATRIFAATLETIRTLLPAIKGTRWSNKSDFYSLFVAIGSLLLTHDLQTGKVASLKKELERFALSVDQSLATSSTKNKAADSYARAVEKGANDKARRATRHEVLVGVIEPLFKGKKA